MTETRTPGQPRSGRAAFAGQHRAHSSPAVPWPSPTAGSQQWTVRYALVAYVASWVAANAFLFLLGPRFPVHAGLGVLIVDFTLLSALLPLRGSGALSLRDLGLRRVPGARSVGYTLLALLAIVLFAIYWGKAVQHSRDGNPFIGVSSQGAFNIALAAFAAAVGAPVVEEVFYRGLVYRCLRNRLPSLIAALIAGTMFGLVHAGTYPVDTLPEKAFFGVVACLLYERTGSLLPGMALHSLIDASNFEVTISGTNTIVVSVFLTLAVVLLASPSLKRLWRPIIGQPMSREHTSRRNPSPAGAAINVTGQYGVDGSEGSGGAGASSAGAGGKTMPTNPAETHRYK
jgi:membrane protease YdiL (CAAX protease family)